MVMQGCRDDKDPTNVDGFPLRVTGADEGEGGLTSPRSYPALLDLETDYSVLVWGVAPPFLPERLRILHVIKSPGVDYVAAERFRNSELTYCNGAASNLKPSRQPESLNIAPALVA